MERKLAAILAADVVGYSALMERDEAGTHERLKAGRKELFVPEIARHNGRVFKVMGDGMLAEFGSVVDAVECAVSLQRSLVERNANVAEDQRIQVRIGINLGEVIVEGDDRYGEGVNIASRLEQLADPGGICVSGKVAKEVEKKLAFGFEFMGEQKVKNIAEPVQAFRVKLDGVPVKHLASVSPKRALPWVAAVAVVVLLAGGAWFTLRTPAPETVVATEPVVADGKPSLVVLPFANLSDNAEQGYLADGITEDLTTELARVPGLFVISRNAAFTYKGKPMQPAQVGKELGVRHILEGSIRRAGDDLRINAQLIDTATGGHIWAERFEGGWSNVFELQDKMIEQIATALKLRLVSGQRASEIAGGTSDPVAYESYLRGIELERSEKPEDWAKAVRHFEQALTLDPKFGTAAAELAMVHQSAMWVESQAAALGVSQDEARSKAVDYVEKAANYPSSTYYQLLSERLLFEQKSDEAIAAAERAIALDASDPNSYLQLSWALIFAGRAADGRGFLDAAMRVDPGWSRWRYYLAGLAYFSLDRFEEAAASLEKLDFQSRGTGYWDFWANYSGLRLLISAYGHLGRSADLAVAKKNIEPYLAEQGPAEHTGLLYMGELPFKNYADFERVLQGLRKAGVPELPFGFDTRSKDRLDGAAIKALLFGHEIKGRRVDTGDAYSRTTAADGTSSVSVGGWSDKGVSRIEGDTMCTFFPSDFRVCFAVFRNPKGTFAQKNEYLAVNPSRPFEFSVVK